MPQDQLISHLTTLGMGLFYLALSLSVSAFSIWFSLALWVQLPLGKILTLLLIALWIIFSLSVLGIYFTQLFVHRPISLLIYAVVAIIGLCWYFSLTPKQDRVWSPEVEKILTYEKQGPWITLNNVRNFTWHDDGSYDIHWEKRSFNLNEIKGVNLIASYWMGPQIAHTLVSFDFEHQQPIVFSLEIRKEKNESFSAIGGFFRQFELSLVAADEKDIIYTRSNIRKEKVYFFPVRIPKQEIRHLFLAYLDTADQLKQSPAWYNTLTSNCTTIIFDMAQAIHPNQLPKDYRILMSGYLPNYLYDSGALNRQWDIKTWYKHAYINPRTAHFSEQTDQSSEAFSLQIRAGLPTASRTNNMLKQ